MNTENEAKAFKSLFGLLEVALGVGGGAGG